MSFSDLKELISKMLASSEQDGKILPRFLNIAKVVGKLGIAC